MDALKNMFETLRPVLPFGATLIVVIVMILAIRIHIHSRISTRIKWL